MGRRASIMAPLYNKPDPSLSCCHYLKQINNGFGGRWGNILQPFCCWFSSNQIPLMAKQACLCRASPRSWVFASIDACTDWVREILLINNVSANEYQVWAVRGWFNGSTQPLSPQWSEWPHVWNNLIIWNYLQTRSTPWSAPHAPPIPALYFPCCNISLALLKPQTQRYTDETSRTGDASLLLHKTRQSNLTSFEPNAWNSWLYWGSSPLARAECQNRPGKFINPRIMIFESIINYPKKWSKPNMEHKKSIIYFFKKYFALSLSLLAGFLCMQLEKNWYNFT